MSSTISKVVENDPCFTYTFSWFLIDCKINNLLLILVANQLFRMPFSNVIFSNRNFLNTFKSITASTIVKIKCKEHGQYGSIHCRPSIS